MAGEVIEAKGLRKQNAVLERLIQKKDSANEKMELNNKRLEIAIGKDTVIKNNYKDIASKCSEKKDKLKENNKKLLKTIFGISSVAILEGVFIYFKYIKP